MFKNAFRAYFKGFNVLLLVAAFIYFGATIFFALLIIGLTNSLGSFNNGVLALLNGEQLAITLQTKDIINVLTSENAVQAYYESLKNYASSIASTHSDEFNAQMDVLARKSAASFTIYYVIGYVVIGVSYFLGSFFSTRRIKKKNNVKGGLIRFVIGKLLESVVFAGLISLATYLLGLRPWTAPISGVVIAVLQAFLALLKASILQKGFHKSTFKDLKFLDAMKFIIINIIFYLALFGIAVGISTLSKSLLLGVLIILPLLIYTDKFLNSYAAIYVIQKQEFIDANNVDIIEQAEELEEKALIEGSNKEPNKEETPVK